MIDSTCRPEHNAVMPARVSPGLRSILRRGWLPAVLVGLCVLWSLLSQVAVVPGLRDPVLLGPDGLLSFLERPTIDARFSFRGEIPAPLKVVYVDVDTESLSELGNLPWNREVFARVTDALFRHGKIRALGFDFVFSAAGLPNLGRSEAEEGTIALGRSIREHQSVVVAASYSSGIGALGKRGGFPFLFDPRTNPYDAELPELPQFPVVGPVWGRVGLIDVINDDVHTVPMFAITEHQTYLAMSLQLALLHYGLPAAAVEIREDAVVLRGGAGEMARIPLWQRQIVEPNWFSPWISKQNARAGVVTVLACAGAMDGDDPADRAAAGEFFSAFRDAIVLIGPTDPLLKDTGPAPLNDGAVPRVSLHGNMLKTIVGDRFIRRPPVWVNLLLISGLGLGVAVLAMAGDHRSHGGRWLSLLLAAAYVGAAFALFVHFDLLIPLVAPIGAAASCALVGVAAQLGAEEQRRRRIKGLFGSYVSAAVVDEIVEKDVLPQTGGAEVEVTAFFSDIAAFTALSEQLPPALLVDVMCEYFAEGTKAITEAGGTLDKYVGDAIIAMFGAPLHRPDHAAAACRAALALQEAQPVLHARWAGGTVNLPAEVLRMHTRVGLNTGKAVVGNIGSELRFNYTMMGSSVNLAQRMEAAAAHYGCDILVSSSTMEAARRDDALLVFRELDRINVPGLASAVGIFELLGRGDDVLERSLIRREAYAAALALYRERRWKEAAVAFMAVSSSEPEAQRKNPSMVMASRCEAYALQGREPGDSGDFVLTKGG